MKIYLYQILWLLSNLEFILNFFRNIPNLNNNDLDIYSNFILSYPNLYDNRSVLYLPYFFFLYYPFAFIPNQIAFILMGLINLVCLNMIFIRSKVLGIEYRNKLLNYCVWIAWYLGFWSNLETLILYCYIELFIALKQKKSKLSIIINALLFSLISFKIYSFIFVLPFLFEIKEKKSIFLYLSLILISQFLFNFYFIFYFPQWLTIDFLKSCFLINPFTDSKKISPLIELGLRPNFIIPLFFIFIFFKNKINRN